MTFISRFDGIKAEKVRMNQNTNFQPIIVSLLKPNLTPVSTQSQLNQVFTKEQEEALEKYLQTFYSNTAHGIDGQGVRKLVYELATQNNINIPYSWKLTRMATTEWLEGYQYRRHLAHVT